MYTCTPSLSLHTNYTITSTFFVQCCPVMWANRSGHSVLLSLRLSSNNIF